MQFRMPMIAVIMNVHTSEVVSRSFGALHKSSIKLSDSQVILHWIHNEEKPLKKMGEESSDRNQKTVVTR